MKFDFKDIAWAGIVTLIVVFLSKCHRDDVQVRDARIGNLQDKAHNDSIQYLTNMAGYIANAKAAHDTATVYTLRNQKIELELDKQSATVLRLSNLLKEQRIQVDTSTIGVGQEYLDYCDSLALTSSDLAVNFNNYKRNISFVLAAKDAELASKDGIITTEQQAKAACKTNYAALMHLYKQQTQNKASTQVFIGAEIVATPAYLINNVGVALSLKTKTNKLWQVSGGLQANGQYYARVNGNILISFKR